MLFLPTSIVHAGQSLPDKGALYPNTIHAVLFPTLNFTSNEPAETTSTIQRDVTTLLASREVC